MTQSFRPLSDYGVVGNTRTMALIHRDGSVDWFCAPNFDSPPCFYPLLDTALGGYYRLEAHNLRPTHRRYVDNTAVLENEYECEAGRLLVTDFMPVIEEGVAGPNTGLVQLARIIECLDGEVTAFLRISPATGFIHRHAGKDPTLENHRSRYELPDRELMIEAEGCDMRLHGRETTIRCDLRKGQRTTVLLTFSQPADLTRHDVGDTCWLKDRTVKYWRDWSNNIGYEGPYREQVVRSAITLKLCQFSPTGAIVAAPTTSLPEKIGAGFNWDYRYTWLRDATLTLVALLSLNLADEAMLFLKFLHAAHQRLKTFPVLTSVFGNKPMPEIELHHLNGYMNSKPVRVGNAAQEQLQLDIYGELIHCIYLLLHHTGLQSNRFSFERDLWPTIVHAVDNVCRNWHKPDKSIWETRGPAKRFVYSQAMCWLALERGIRIAEYHDKPVPEHWREALEQVRHDFHQNAYSLHQRSYVQAYGADDLDASVLRLTLMGMFRVNDHRVRSTIHAIERELMQDGYVLRNRNLDGGAAGEGAFLPCSFWYVDNLVLTGRLHEAREIFERLLACSNDLGLYSEEYDTKNKVMLGNFPQAFTHVSVINSAIQLAIAARGHFSESHHLLGRTRETTTAP